MKTTHNSYSLCESFLLLLTVILICTIFCLTEVRREDLMIVCVCNALNESAVREAAQKHQGKTSILKIYQSLDAKPQCGKCLCHARDICNEEYQTLQAS